MKKYVYLCFARTDFHENEKLYVTSGHRMRTKAELEGLNNLDECSVLRLPYKLWISHFHFNRSTGEYENNLTWFSVKEFVVSKNTKLSDFYYESHLRTSEYTVRVYNYRGDLVPNFYSKFCGNIKEALCWFGELKYRDCLFVVNEAC